MASFRINDEARMIRLCYPTARQANEEEVHRGNLSTTSTIMKPSLTGSDWDYSLAEDLCETPPVVAQLRVVAPPRATPAQDQDLELRNQTIRDLRL